MQLRTEDGRLLRGAGRYVDDFEPKDNVGYLGLVRSPYAHAKISKIDFSKVKNDPEFVTCLSGGDLAKEGLGKIAQVPFQRPADRYHLAVGKVRYVGEPVAAVVSRNKYSVEDLIESVEVQYEPLPVVGTIEESSKAECLIYEEWKNNISFQNQTKTGDPERAFATAPHKIRARISMKRQAGVPIESRAVVASYNKLENKYEVYATVQSAHRLQGYLSAEMNVPKDRIRVRVNDVGGGFGTKGAPSYAAPLLSCLLSKKTGLSIKWTSTRTEDLLETAQGRDEYCDIELACDGDAKLVGLKAFVESDAGVQGSYSLMAALTLRLLPGAYRIPNLDLKCECYVTNKVPLGPVRGAGRPEACFFIERAMDIMARHLRIDPTELRRKNLIQPNEFPYNNGAGSTYDSGDFPRLLDTLLQKSDYEELINWKQKINGKKDENALAGVGICVEVEDTGAQMSETARVVVSRDAVTIYTGSSPHGQGHETTLAQLCSKELGIPFERIRVVWGDTSAIPSGIGTFGSRSAVTGGSAVLQACKIIKAESLKKASEIFKKDVSRLDFKDGQIVSLENRGRQEAQIGLNELVNRIGSDLEAYTNFKLEAMPFSSSAHLCALVVDKETGKVHIEKYVVVDDCGNVINEVIVDGQIQGGTAHGIGGAVLEEIVYDKQGQLLTSNFLDYTIPTSLDVPNFEISHIATPSPLTPSGAKGVGESGTIAAHPAVINAINGALSNVTDQQVNVAPATPEVIYKALRG